MASWMLHATKAITKCVKNVNVMCNGTAIGLLTPQTLLLQNARNTSFFIKRPAADLWKAVTSVSNAGKKRGRAKGLPRMKNLGKGQMFGVGKVPMVFPGLNTLITYKNQRTEPSHIEDQEVLPHNITPIIQATKKRIKVHPLNRGWSGSKPGGRKIGPPDPIAGDTFEGFESWVLQCNRMNTMSGTLGRVKRYRCIVVTGNRNGLVGFTNTIGNAAKSTLNTAKQRAGQRIFYVERYNDHTVIHDFFTQFGHTKIFVKQKPKGYGLKCHRVIKTCCEAVGITDLYAKVEGSTNVAYLVKAFFIGLLQQKTPEEMANEKKLHLIEMRKENNYFPTVLASPAVTREAAEIPSNEILNFKQYVMNGKIPLWKKRRQPFYTKLPSWKNHLCKQERQRGQFDVMIRLRATYGDHCSFLAEKYPEAAGSKWRKHDKKTEESI